MRRTSVSYDFGVSFWMLLFFALLSLPWLVGCLLEGSGRRPSLGRAPCPHLQTGLAPMDLDLLGILKYWGYPPCPGSTGLLCHSWPPPNHSVFWNMCPRGPDSADEEPGADAL